MGFWVSGANEQNGIYHLSETGLLQWLDEVIQAAKRLAEETKRRTIHLRCRPIHRKFWGYWSKRAEGLHQAFLFSADNASREASVLLLLLLLLRRVCYCFC